jgi:Ala-tRNA(Pro) deacylase
VAYGIPTVVDHELFDREDLYFEGGDHGSFVHLAREEFQRLMTRSLRASFCGGCQ